ncbi:autotransporter outer membrane beta-barrel domain-containing protein [Yersinia massiliensis]|uniref:autotransporter outer membrane beta-barrel domain-containing protein n=1 Tax=Yersinia massiliensis TaxID=419257 RepID=UPI001CFC4BFA|nr:autotransporter outer membrane beta-barrel domain-containing protein [Yersinia massiliensis]MCB5307732.1 autotransporter outer membrane beta-barrel domain-containing protein [Yersinia massiliensis]
MKNSPAKTFKKKRITIIISLAVGLFSAPSFAGCNLTICTDTTFWDGIFGDDYSITNTFDLVSSPTNAVVGLYKNQAGEMKFGNNLYISVSGNKADAIQVKSGASANNPAIITVGNNATIYALGASGDGINAGNNTGSSLITLGNDAEIFAKYGIGVRANLTNTAGQYNNIVLGDRANITTEGSGSNLLDGLGYGVYAGNREMGDSGQTGSASVTLGKDSSITTSGNSADGIFANKSGVVNLGDGTKVTTSGTNANGLKASTGLYTNTRGGIINILGGLAINVSGSNSNAIYATGAGSEIKSFDAVNNQSTAGVFNIDGNILAEKGGLIDLNLAEGSVFSGVTKSIGSTSSNNGVINLAMSGNSSIWNMSGNSDLTSLNLANGAIVNYVDNSSTFKTLTVTGNYHSDGGYIYFNTALNDDTSETDKLLIEGNTSGTTYVVVRNAGGMGNETLEGIELIRVNGDSDGEFIQSGRIVAGAYDYSLNRGQDSSLGRSHDGKSSHWYLTNVSAPIVTPIDPPETVDPTPPVEVGPKQKVERPEASGYSANLAAANNMFVTRLHDRVGDTQYIDALTGEQRITSLWMRNEGGHTRSKDSHDQLGTQSNRYVLQLGGDIAQWSNNDADSFHLGIMGGYGNSKSRTESRLSGYSARSSVDGYSLGMYGTWYANEADKSGFYVDSWAQYSWFNNRVEGQELATETYKSSGVTASIESGYTFKVGENVTKNATYFIQPKAQITWMGVKADDHKEDNGTQVSGEGDGNIQTRLGVKAFMKGYADQDKGKNRVFQPFVEVNWIHNTKDFGTTMDGMTVKQDGAANIGELKLGVEGQLNKNVNIWGNIGQQIGNKGYSDTAMMLGVKYHF